MQLSIPDLSDAAAASTATRALQALDPGARVVVDLPRRQLHAHGRVGPQVAIAALGAAGLRASLSGSARAVVPAHPRCGCGCGIGAACRCR